MNLTDDIYLFLRDLAVNNNRDWFNEHKKRYEKSVKEPFNDLVQELIAMIKATDEKDLSVTPKECVFRIYRDVRFSKDKSPYKIHLGAIITPKGRKGMTEPGTYFEVSPEHIRLYGGMYQPTKEQLIKVRTAISNDPAAFKKAYSAKGFKDDYGTLRGEQNKIIPKEFKEAGEKEPLIYNKQFYYFTEWPVEEITSPNFLKDVKKRYKNGLKMKEFLKIALK